MLKTMISILVILFTMFSCGKASAGTLEISERENQISFIPGEAQRMWEDYTFNTLALDDYQPGCEPMQHRPDANVPFRGVVILLHGFTSCPKQFSAMAGSFTQLGYHVLVPILPGHGRAGADELTEQTDLPGVRNWHKYEAFAHWLNTLASLIIAYGEVHIGGLCLGGTIATRAVQLDPKLYTRGIMLSPFFEISKPLIGRIGRLIGRMGDVIKMDHHLDMPVALDDVDVCENYERKILGRAGYCRVRLSNLISVSRFAQFVKSNWREVSTSYQTILVHNDPVAHPQTTLTLLENGGLTSGIKSRTCVMNASASHSMFSLTDLPQPKPWAPALHKELSEFIADGKPLTQTNAGPYHWPMSIAAVGSCRVFP